MDLLRELTQILEGLEDHKKYPLVDRVNADLVNEFMHKKPARWADLDSSAKKIPLERVKAIFGGDLRRRSFTIKSLWGERPESPSSEFVDSFRNYKEPIVVVDDKKHPKYVIHSGGFNYPRYMTAVK